MSNYMKLCLSITVAMGLIAYGWAAIIGFGYPIWKDYVFSGILFSVFASVAMFYTHVRRDPKIAGPCWAIATFVFYMPFAIMYSYAIQTLNFPLADPLFVKWDAALGFHWLEWAKWYASFPQWFSEWSSFIYASSAKTMFATAAFLIVTGRHKQLDEFVLLFLLTSTITSTISGFLPGENAYEYFKVSGELDAALSPVVGQGYMTDFYAIRDGSLQSLKVVDVQGLVAFPSFHTILSLVLIYVMRGSGIFFVISLIWNALIIATVPFDGAHYLTDMLSGVLVAIVAIAFMHWLEPRLNAFYAREKREPSGLVAAE
ncbi:MAG: phosphatase PAP2 family protein [Pseudomonadota bacterium]